MFVIIFITAFSGFRLVNPMTSISILNYTVNFDDDRIAAWYAENIFVWTVTNTRLFSQGPWNQNIWTSTSFDVDVHYNIKWSLGSKITVTQDWGKSFFWVTHTIDQVPLIEAWTSYVFMTTWDKPQLLGHPNQHILLTDIPFDDKSKMQEFIRNNSDVKQMRLAYQNEELYDNGLRIGSGKNAYQILSASELNDFRNFEAGFVE